MTYGLRSKNAQFTDNDIIILDTLGELGKMYSICHVAFIGGSFNKTGGHNPLESAVYNKPTLSGPSIHNFKDIYSILTNSKAGKVVSTPDELFLSLKSLFADDLLYKETENSCKKVFAEQKGALEFVIYKLRAVLQA